MAVYLMIIIALVASILVNLIKYLVKNIVCYIKEQKHKRLENALNYLLEHEKELVRELLAQQTTQDKTN